MYFLTEDVANPSPVRAALSWYSLPSWKRGTRFYVSDSWLGVSGDPCGVSHGTAQAVALFPHLERGSCRSVHEVMQVYGLTHEDLPWVIDTLVTSGHAEMGWIEEIAESRVRLGHIPDVHVRGDLSEGQGQGQAATAGGTEPPPVPGPSREEGWNDLQDRQGHPG